MRPEPDHPEQDEILSAAWQLGPTGSLIDWIKEPDYPADPNFSPDWKTLDERFYPIGDELAEAQSLEEFRAIQMREVKRQDAMATISEGGPAALGTAIGVDLLDPVMLPFWFVPFVGQAGRAMNMAKFGGAVATEIGAREILAHHQQPSRTARDTLPVMIGATALGMGLGAIMRPSIKDVVPSATKQRMVRELAEKYDESFAESTVGAQAATAYGSPARMKKERALTPKWVKKLTLSNPKWRVAHSTDHGLAEPSQAVDELARTHVVRARDKMGESPRYPAGRINPWEEEVEGLRRSLAATGGQIVRQARKILKQKYGVQMSRAETSALISRIGAYGDDTSQYAELLPLIRDFRKVKQLYAERGAARGMFGWETEPVISKATGKPLKKTQLKKDAMGRKIPIKLGQHKYNKHHASRFYDVPLIRKLPNEFVAAVVRGYKAAGDPRTTEELTERALNAWNNITSSAKIMPNDGGGVAVHFGPKNTKPITLKIQDEYIEKFLIRDAEAELASLGRDFIPILTALERYGDDALEYGSKGLMIKPLRERLVEEFVDKRTRMTELDAEKFSKMAKGHAQDLIDIQHLINKISGADRHLGILDSKWSQGLNELRAWTSFSWLGNASLASVHEVARAAIEHSFTNFARSFGMVINPTDLAKANIQQLRAYHMGLDTQIARSSNLLRAEVEEAVALRGAGSFASRHVDKVYQYSGMNHLMRFTKDVEALSFLTDVVQFATGKQNVKAGSAAYESAMDSFTRYGIGKKYFNRIAKEVKSGGIVQENGVWLINSDKFKDGGLLHRIRTVQAGAGEQALVGTGVGEVPIVLDNPIGRSLVQFKRVFFGYSGRMGSLAERLGRGDMRAASGLLTTFAMTWTAYQVRLFMRHFSKDPSTAAEEFQKEWGRMALQDHVREAIERSGYTGMLFEMFSQADNAAKGGLSHALRLNEGSKHHYRNASIMGNLAPSLSYLEKATQAAMSPTKEGGITARDIENASYLVPLRTIIYLDPIFDQMNKVISENLPEGERRKRRYRKAETQGVTF